VRASYARRMQQARRRHVGNEAPEPAQQARVLVAPDRGPDARGLLSDVDDGDDGSAALWALVHRVD
jgi:hypothetical protein